jgi:hypothetical protein
MNNKQIKPLLILVIALLTASTIKAQSNNQLKKHKDEHGDFYKIKYGIVAGVNISNVLSVTDIPYFKDDIRAGMHIGGSVDVPVCYPLTFEGEVIFSRKGYRAYTLYGNFTQNRDFIDIPLLAKLHVTNNFSFLIGPQISFLSSVYNDYKEGFQENVENIYDLKNANFEKQVLSGVAGVTFNLTPNVEFRIRYAVDAKKKNANNQDLHENIPQFQNQVWQMGFGYRFWK